MNRQVSGYLVPYWWRLILVLAISLISTETATTVQGVSVDCQGIEVVSHELTRSEAEKYCRYAAGERRKVEKYWGATWEEPIRVEVSSSFRIARSLVTNGWKPGKTEMPLDRVRMACRSSERCTKAETTRRRIRNLCKIWNKSGAR